MLLAYVPNVSPISDTCCSQVFSLAGIGSERRRSPRAQAALHACRQQHRLHSLAPNVICEERKNSLNEQCCSNVLNGVAETPRGMFGYRDWDIISHPPKGSTVS